MSSLDTILLDSEGTENFIRGLMSSLVYSTKASNALPGEEGGSFDYYSTFEKFSNESSGLSDSISALIRRVCQIVDPSTAAIQIPSDMMESSLYELVVDMIDILLEGADLKLDSATGVRASLNAVVKEALALDRDRIFRETTADIPKPQVKYENSRTRPFRPNISEKPNAISPLDLCELPVEDDEGHTTERPATFYPHPYEEELRAFGKNLYTKQPPYVVDSGYVRPVMPQGAALRPFAYIDTVEDLATAAEEMEGFSELAVDLEHHAYRSFQGITCLMQISTREKDYVLDAIILRQNLQAALLPLFTDPEIVKVFHGCDSDILWLQKDFGLYVVNCFDTYHAAKALRYPALSLAHLLKYHCGITLNKKHQLADWRIRPLPEDMLCYARSDTHYLLYIYDCLRRDIYTAQGVSALLAVWMASMHTCLKRYEKEPFYPLGYTRLFTDSRGWSGAPAAVDVSPEQHIALASLWSWRDSMARREDESPLFIMSNAELLRIGRAIPLTEESLLECSPLSAFVRAHMNDLMETLLEPLRGAGSKLTETIPSQSSRLGHTSAADDTNCSGGSGTSSTPVHTPGRVGLGAWSVQDATRARHGQVKRLEGCVSVSQIIPSTAITPIKSYKDRSITAAASPGSALYLASSGSVMGGAVDEGEDMPPPPAGSEWDQLFSEAMWNRVSSPSVLHLQRATESPIDALLRTMSPTTVNAVTRCRLERVVEELKAKTATVARGGAEGFYSLDQRQSPSLEVRSPGRAAMTPSPTAEALPQSLTEIYDISNRNRWRNKDKKRNRDPSADNADLVPETVHARPVPDGQADMEDGEWYAAGADAYSDKGLEGSLDLAVNVGWVPSASRDDVMRKHLADEHTNATAQFQTPSGDEITQQDGGSRVTVEPDRRTGTRPGGGARGGGSVAHGKNGKQRSNSGDRSSGSRSGGLSFDYSRVSQGTVGMGAMATSGASGSGAKYNPFVQGGPTAGAGQKPKRSNSKDRGNSKERANKKPGNPQGRGGGGGIERRDRERSHVFSSQK